MARFDLYAAPDGTSGYWLDVQVNLLDAMSTRVVLPLVPIEDFPRPARGLNPVFEIDGARFVMLTHFIGAVPRKQLSKHVSSLAAERDTITAALDMLLFTGI